MAPAGEFLTALGRQAGNHLWQSTAMAAVAAVLAFVLRTNHARSRYWLWLAASLKFLLPFSVLAAVGARLGGWLIPACPAASVSIAVQQIAQPFTAIQPRAPLAAVAPAPSASFPFAELTLALWVCGFLAVVIRWWMSWRKVAAAVRASAPLTEGREVEAMRRVWVAICRIGAPRVRGASLQLAESAVEPTLKRPRRLSAQQAWTPAPRRLWWSFPQIVCSAANLEPGIFGIFRPVLWLPSGIADRLSDAELEAIIAHELLHARRRDNLAAAIHMAVEAIFWFHPLVWWLGARLTEERERACDEEVLRMGADPQVYAEGILRVCEFYVASPILCAPGITGGALKRRVESIVAHRFARELGLLQKALLSGALSAVFAAPLFIGFGHIQATAADRPGVVGQKGSRLTFEVASVKPAPERDYGTQARPTGMAPAITGDPAQITFNDVSLVGVISRAFGVRPLDIKAPGWMQDLKYDIHAKVPANAPKGHIPEMLQNLLTDRFQLKTHWETHEEPGYVLTVAKGGLKLKKSAPDTPRQSGFRSNGHFEIRHVTIAEFANGLTVDMGRPVVDKTGLSGEYDIVYDAEPDSMPGFLKFAPGHSESDFPTIFAALRLLGLNLASEQKVVKKSLVVDSALKVPTEN